VAHDDLQVFGCERAPAFARRAMQAFAASHRVLNEGCFPVLANVGVKWFELVADSRDVIVHGVGLDEM